MLYWSSMFLFIVLSAGLLVIALAAAGARKRIPWLNSRARGNRVSQPLPFLSRIRTRVLGASRRIRIVRFGRLQWRRGAVNLVIFTTPIIAALVSIGLYHVYFDRTDLPDIEALIRFEVPTIGTVYDANDQPLIELAKEYRKIVKYEDIPPIVRDAIIATEDKDFFSHSGVNYSVLPRVLSKVRMRALACASDGIRRPRQIAIPAGRIDDHATACARVFS